MGCFSKACSPTPVIPTADLIALHAHQHTQVRPAQFATQCVVNLLHAKGKVKLPEIAQITELEAH